MTELGSIRQGIGQGLGLGSGPANQRTDATLPTPNMNHLQEPAEPLAIHPAEQAPVPSEIDRRLSAAQNRPAGPPPTFEASLLEIEADIDAILKRLEAAREKDKTDMAIRPSPDAQSPQGVAPQGTDDTP